jgi:uncharacterized protein
MMTPDLPPYPDSTILVVEVGSGAHGTGLPGKEDHDETAIWIESPAEVFALRDGEPRSQSVRTQPEGVPSGPSDTDRNLYTLRRFLSLAANGNPSILLVLWGPIMQTTPFGEELRDMRSAFVGRHLIPKYRGYMRAQRDRLLGMRGGRHGHPREDGAGFDTKYAMHAARLGYQGIELLSTGEMRLPIEWPMGDWLRAVRRGEVPFDKIIERIDTADRILATFADEARLPLTADRERIVEWSQRTHRAFWKREG